MNKKRIALHAISFSVNCWIIYNVYFEAGPFTTAMLSLIYITFLLQSVLNSAQQKINKVIVDILDILDIREGDKQ